MFSFFRKKTPAPVVTPETQPGPQLSADAGPTAATTPAQPPSDAAPILQPQPAMEPAAATDATPVALAADATKPDTGLSPANLDAPAPMVSNVPSDVAPVPDAEAPRTPPVTPPAVLVGPAEPDVPTTLPPGPAMSSTAPAVSAPVIAPSVAAPASPAAAKASRWWTPPWSKASAQPPGPGPAAQSDAPVASPAPEPTALPLAEAPPVTETPAPPLSPVAAPAPSEAWAPPPAPEPLQAPTPAAAAVPTAMPSAPMVVVVIPPPDAAPPAAAPRTGWMDKLKAGLRKTGSSIATVFTGTRIDDDLYDELEAALLMADTGVKATEFLLADLKRRVKESKTTDPVAVKGLLADAIADLLAPLQKVLVVGDRPDNLHNGQHGATVIMVAGVNGAGKTTSIGKLTKHLADHGASVLLAAADTFRAAAREQLAVWADRNTVEIISQQGGDPAAVSFDAVSAGRARGKDVVLVDTAGRLPTQLHLMEELKKIKRVVQKADATAPHEVLLVIDGNTGQNALTQVKAFDDALALTGLVVTKLDGTAKGGVLCAIAREKPVPVYFIGVGEKLEDLETFNAREFAQALLA